MQDNGGSKLLVPVVIVQSDPASWTCRNRLCSRSLLMARKHTSLSAAVSACSRMHEAEGANASQGWLCRSRDTASD